MSIETARKFLRQAAHDQDLRDRLNTAEGVEARQQILQEAGLAFCGCELEEAFNNELTRCQSETAAEDLKDLHQWWTLLQTL